MKLRSLSISLTIVCISASAALACGPGVNPASPQGPAQGTPERQRWVHKRLEHLSQNQEHYENEKVRYKLLMTPLGGEPSDLYEIAKFKAWEAQTSHQRHMEKVETLMLKRENGTITPAENHALNKWLRTHNHH